MASERLCKPIADLHHAVLVRPRERAAVADHDAIEGDDPARPRIGDERHGHRVGSIGVRPARADTDVWDPPAGDGRASSRVTGSRTDVM